MPELPEVEVVRRGIARWASGRTITNVTVFHPRAIRRHMAGAQDFVVQLYGQCIGEVYRRGKYLWLRVGSEAALVAHLGMSGQLLIRPPTAADEKHLRVRITLTDGDSELRFVDQRTFGVFYIDELPDNEGSPTRENMPLPPSLAHIAPDPLDAAFDSRGLARVLCTRRTDVKRALLNQTVVSGIGNIYADEALWRAQMHYRTPTQQLTEQTAMRLIDEVRGVLLAALDHGGTSFDALYVNVNGQSGYFGTELAVYGQAGNPCPRCGDTIVRETFMNRSSYLCPTCQF